MLSLFSLFLLAGNGAYVYAKFITSDNGVTSLSDSFHTSTTLLHPEVALPVLSTIDDYEEYSKSLALLGMKGGGNTLAVIDAFDYLQQKKVAERLGINEDETVDYALNAFKVYSSTTNL
jgi:hypothetical protein